MKLFVAAFLAFILVASARNAEKQSIQKMKQRQQLMSASSPSHQQGQKIVSSSSSSSSSESSSSSSSSSSESQEQRQKHNRQVERHQQSSKSKLQSPIEKAVDKVLDKLRVQNLHMMPQQQKANIYLQALQSVAMLDLFNNTEFKKHTPKSGLVRSSDEIYDPILFKKRAVRKWIMRGFVNTYKTFAPPSGNELQDAIRTFNSLQLGDYTTNGKSGVLISTPVSNLKKIVDIWVNEGIVSRNDGEELKLSMDGDEGQKYIKENSNRQNERTLVFSVTGFISLRLSESEKDPMGTLVYALTRFQFQTAMEIVYESTTKCIIWGLVCETRVTAKPNQRPISAKESEDVWNYIKYNTMKTFTADNKVYLDYLDDEAVKYERFLPDIFRDDYQKMADNPTTPPDQLIPHDAFDPASYNLGW